MDKFKSKFKQVFNGSPDNWKGNDVRAEIAAIVSLSAGILGTIVILATSHELLTSLAAPLYLIGPGYLEFCRQTRISKGKVKKLPSN